MRSKNVTLQCSNLIRKYCINVICTLYGWMWTDFGVRNDNHETEIMRNNNCINVWTSQQLMAIEALIFFRQWINSHI